MTKIEGSLSLTIVRVHSRPLLVQRTKTTENRSIALPSLDEVNSEETIFPTLMTILKLDESEVTSSDSPPTTTTTDWVI